jgi:hypothetical protein
MTVRIIWILAGALFGALCMLGMFHMIGDLRTNWSVVFLVAAGMGSLALLCGKEFWKIVLWIWPW